MNKIEACWWRGSGNNFGDLIAPKIISRLTNLEVRYSKNKGSLCSIGSIALHQYPNAMQFWGSGVISADSKSYNAKDHEYHSVRGPLSRRKIIESGGECPEIYGDPGLLIPYLFEIERQKKEYEFSIFPHYADYKKAKKMIEGTSFGIIDIKKDTMEVIKEASKSSFLICSSLHALMLAESLSIPCCLVKLGDNLFGKMFKFEDYYNSTNREIRFVDNSKDNRLTIDKYQRLWASTPKMKIDLRPMLDSFPFEIKNKNIIKKFYKTSNQ